MPVIFLSYSFHSRRTYRILSLSILPLNSSWREVNTPAPPSPTPPPSNHLQTCCVPFLLSFFLYVYDCVQTNFSSPIFHLSDSRYAFTGNNRFWFHGPPAPKWGIHHLPVFSTRYDTAQILATSSLPAGQPRFPLEARKPPSAPTNRGHPARNADDLCSCA